MKPSNTLNDEDRGLAAESVDGEDADLTRDPEQGHADERRREGRDWQLLPLVGATAHQHRHNDDAPDSRTATSKSVVGSKELMSIIRPHRRRSRDRAAS